MKESEGLYRSFRFLKKALLGLAVFLVCLLLFGYFFFMRHVDAPKAWRADEPAPTLLPDDARSARRPPRNPEGRFRGCSGSGSVARFIGRLREWDSRYPAQGSGARATPTSGSRRAH